MCLLSVDFFWWMKWINHLLMNCLCPVFICLLSGVLVSDAHALSDPFSSCLLGLFCLHLTETHLRLLKQKRGLCFDGPRGAARETQGLCALGYFFPESSPPLHAAWSSSSSLLSLTVTSSQRPVFARFLLWCLSWGERECGWAVTLLGLFCNSPLALQPVCAHC